MRRSSPQSLCDARPGCTQPAQGLSPTKGAAGIGGRRIRQTLRENVVRAFWRVTEETACAQANPHRDAVPGQINQAPLIITVDAAGRLGAASDLMEWTHPDERMGAAAV
jgi:hypothetical protein